MPTDTWPYIPGAVPPFADHPARACADTPTDDFYPEKGGMAPYIVAAAKAICGGCPLRAACLDWAIDQNETGIWGGTTERERMQIRARRAHGRVPVPVLRQQQVMALLAAQHTTAEVAERVGVTVRSVTRIRSRVRAGLPEAA